MAIVYLKSGREGSLNKRHPWVFSGAIGHTEGDPEPGATVEVHGQRGRIGRGAISPRSEIRVRMWSFDPEALVTRDFLAARVAGAIARRSGVPELAGLTALRLVNAESDGLPGLVVDRYGDTLVVQFLAAGAEHWREAILDTLEERLAPAGIVERSDVAVRDLEGLPRAAGVVRGAEPGRLCIDERGRRYRVDLTAGQKTGFYLDQRQNRALVQEHARDRQVLDAFCYTGGFTVAALCGGARMVTALDTSASALALVADNVAENGLPAERVEPMEADVFQELRRFRDARRRFDLIVLDPPRFAETRSGVEGALRGYKDINLLACKLLAEDGLLFTFSCSGRVAPALFRETVAAAARDSGRFVQVLRRLGHGADHPVALSFPEGAYLKGLLCRVGG